MSAILRFLIHTMRRLDEQSKTITESRNAAKAVIQEPPE